MKFVTAYEVTRHYGGPEEGGWWYNWYTVIDTIGPTNEPAAMVEWFQNRYSDHATGDIYSVLGGVTVSVIIEDEPAENKSTERPHYS